jgi:hypothetical protein
MWRHSRIRYPFPLPSLLFSPLPMLDFDFSPSFLARSLKCSFLQSSSNYGVSLLWNFHGNCSWFYLLLLIEAPNVNFFVCASGGAHSRTWSHYLCTSGCPHQGTLFWCTSIVHVLLLHLCCTCCLIHFYCASIFTMLMFWKVVLMVLDLHGLVLLFKFWPPCAMIMFLAFLCCSSTLDLFMVRCSSILDLFGLFLNFWPSYTTPQLLTFLCVTPQFILNNCCCFSFSFVHYQ